MSVPDECERIDRWKEGYDSGYLQAVRDIKEALLTRYAVYEETMGDLHASEVFAMVEHDLDQRLKDLT